MAQPVRVVFNTQTHNLFVFFSTPKQDFKEGFGSDMEQTLAQYYPRHLLSELATYQARSIMVGRAARCGTK